ncbi:unnamed protein product [marine sediment metagenome]|uniref:Uncharacterized protein n=1 Tax=marine sediment metagenome TaxID=412755 RepID=X0UNX2_9ZZZZ
MKFNPKDRVCLSDGTIGEVRKVREDGMVLVTITAWGQDKQVHESELRKV